MTVLVYEETGEGGRLESETSQRVPSERETNCSVTTGAQESQENQAASYQSPLLKSPGEQRNFPFTKSAYAVCAMTPFSLPVWRQWNT